MTQFCEFFLPDGSCLLAKWKNQKNKQITGLGATSWNDNDSKMFAILAGQSTREVVGGWTAVLELISKLDVPTGVVGTIGCGRRVSKVECNHETEVVT